MSVNEANELNRLNFEDLLWIIFALLCFANVYGDDLQKKYVKSHLNNYEKKSNQVFTFTLIVTLLIYIYFFLRNYNFYKLSSETNKDLYRIKVSGSVFLIVGVVFLIYFQVKNEDFIGSPSL